MPIAAIVQEYRQEVNCVSAWRRMTNLANPMAYSAAQTPSRAFPFGQHLDILSLPIVEGMSFDVADFSE
jgi:hypothetical protein